MDILGNIIGVLFLFFAIMYLRKKKTLRGYAKKRIETLWSNVDTHEYPAQKVLEADKVLHAAFKELGCKGDLGSLLKRHGSRLPNLDDVWMAHKLRNRIAHDAGIQVSEKDAARAVQAFRRAVYSFL